MSMRGLLRYLRIYRNNFGRDGSTARFELLNHVSRFLPHELIVSAVEICSTIELS